MVRPRGGCVQVAKEPNGGGTSLCVGWGWNGLESVPGGSGGRKEMNKVKEVGACFPGRRHNTCRCADIGE